MAKIEIVPGTIKLIKMTDNQYFSDDYKEYISNSKLGLINPDEGGSPEKYELGFKSDYSDSFELGSAVHAIVLQPDEYIIAKIHKPTGKLGVFAEKAYPSVMDLANIATDISTEIIEDASKQADYYVGKLTSKRVETALAACVPYWEKRREYEYTLSEEIKTKQIYLSAPIYDKYNQCMLGINANSKFYEILYPKGLLNNAEFFNEYAILCEVDLITDEETIRLKLKAKLDNFTIDHETQTVTLNDLKTSGKPVNYFMGNKVKTFTVETGEQWVWYDGSFQKYHYYRQLGMYLWLLQCAVKELYGFNYKSKANMLVIETIPDFKCKIFPVNGTHIKTGLEEFKNLLIMVAKWKSRK